MRGGAARRDQRNAQAHARGARLLLQLVQRSQQGLEWAARQRQLGLADFMRLKGFQPFGLVHALGFVREQHRVAVKRNPQLVGVIDSGGHRFGQHPRSRKAQRQRFAHVLLVGRQKQVRPQRPQVAEGVAPLGENAPLQGQACLFGRAKNPQRADRIVAREDDHLHIAGVGGVEGQQLFHELEGHPRFGRYFQPRLLQFHVGARVQGVENAVFLFKVKQRA